MSTNKPPTTSGSSLEKAGRKQSNLPMLVAVFLLFHAVVLGGILWVGCKPHKPEPIDNEAPPPVLPPIGSSDTNFFPPLPPISGSPAVPPTPMSSGGVVSQPIEPPTSLPSGPVDTRTAPPVMPTPISAPEPPPGRPTIVTPTTPPPPPGVIQPSPSVGSRKHTVSRGDTYYSIKDEYGTTMQALKAANPGVDPLKLQLGQTLNVPAPAPRTGAPAGNPGSIYVVKSGDNLGKIAIRHKTTVSRLRELNGLSSDRIRVGQKLKVPVR